jgi:hypothetical protein
VHSGLSYHIHKTFFVAVVMSVPLQKMIFFVCICDGNSITENAVLCLWTSVQHHYRRSYSLFTDVMDVPLRKVVFFVYICYGSYL